MSRGSRSKTTGINLRHARSCRASGGGRCSCDPSYVAEVYLAAENRRLRKSFPSLAAARAWRDDAGRAAKAHRLRPGAVTVREAAAAFFADIEAGVALDRAEKPYKPKTVREYASAIERHVDPALGSRRLGDVTRDDLKALIRTWQRAGASPSAIRNRLSPLRVVFRRALDVGDVAFSPFDGLRVPSLTRSRRRAVTPMEARRLLDVLPAAARVAYATATYAGLRRGELMALRWSDVQLTTNRIVVSASWDEVDGRIETKSRAGTRTVPMIAALAAELSAWRSNQAERGPTWVVDDAHVFPGRSPQAPFTPTNLRRKAHAAWTSAGLEPLMLHEGRHSAASAMIAAGATVKDVQAALGHSDAATTLDVYGHLLGDAVDVVRERLDRYHERAG